MGILLDIANRSADKTLTRLAAEGGSFKSILAEEIEKELDSIKADKFENEYILNDWDEIIEH